ncbi:Receptor-like protein kinase FERONIA [Acorus gramineus]|uniref:Receptor-like protein kinase FERONIA n=1 Tax=Acorus gramineus TaxID=55184 RepID=A0AAV9ANR6_ACOGR|nr:Receptor-like protein kinase FERONIA [Acorus gramineus]
MASVYLLIILCFIAVVADSAATSTHILLNCGASSNSSDMDGREWASDTSHALSSPSTSASNADHQDPSVQTVPYMTARTSKSAFIYTFRAAPGRAFVRLYFYPSDYDHGTLTASDALFSVTAGPYTLLDNFNASVTAQASATAHITREFALSIPSAGVLSLTFSPSRPGASYAFVNGIEVVSVPELFGSGQFNSPVLLNSARPTQYVVDANTAFETVARLNVGGSSLSPGADSGGLYRSWVDDSPYIFGAAVGVSYAKDPNMTIRYPTTVPGYVAPPEVYSTARSMGPNAAINLNYNLTWIVPVDAGFYYVIRLHFCEIQFAVTGLNKRVFDVFIDNQTAVRDLDVISMSGGAGIPYYTDFVVAISRGGEGEEELWVALHPNVVTRPEYYDAMLNGMEVFKLNDSAGNLAGPNPTVRAEKPGSVGPVWVGLSSSGDSMGRGLGVVGGLLCMLVLSWL